MLLLDKLQGNSKNNLSRNQLIVFAILAILCVLGVTNFMQAASGGNQSSMGQAKSDYGVGAYSR
jgi:hypothetical protein